MFEDCLTVLDWDDASKTATKIITLAFNSLESIKFRTFQSTGGHYHGGRIEIVGYMGNDWKDRLVFKMERPEYRRFKSLVKAMIEHKLLD